jgi:phospholipid/cholesterol/gamma-HCH transport system permease protein
MDHIIFDFSNLHKIDSSGVILLIRYIHLFENTHTKVTFQNISNKYQDMIDLYKENYTHKDYTQKETKQSPIYTLGKQTSSYIHSIQNFLTFIGRIFVMFLYSLRHPSKMRIKATILQMDIAAIHILPIIGLSLFLVGFVTAYQGAEQLGRFGASIIVIEMSTMSMFREIAPFLAAVIVAGRSASSFTAQIGTMKITEEISAMKTMGFEVDHFLFIPRILALVIVMPLIVFFADMAAMLGEMVVIKLHMGIPYTQFIDRIYEYMEIRHILLGIFKAPLFGFLIAIIGCYRGLQVHKGTDIGRYTTKAVVDAIFWLIVINALISLLSIELGF